MLRRTKVCVLEVEQHPQAANERHQQKEAAQRGLCIKMFDGKAAEIVDEG